MPDTYNALDVEIDLWYPIAIYVCMPRSYHSGACQALAAAPFRHVERVILGKLPAVWATSGSRWAETPSGMTKTP